MRLIKLLTISLLVFSLIGSLYATDQKQQLNDLFDQANQAYKADDISTAHSLYAQIVEQGYSSPKLFYNLANCYYKEKSFASAILYYERALKLNPDDEDIAHNLEIARAQIVDNVEPLPKFFLSNYWDNLSMSITPNQWGIWFLAILTVCCALFTLFFVAREKKWKQAGFSFGLATALAAAFLLSAGIHAKNITSKPEGIIFDATVNVKSEPNLNSTDQFVIHEGLKVEVLQTEDDWVRIKMQDGNSGWIQNQSIEII